MWKDASQEDWKYLAGDWPQISAYYLVDVLTGQIFIPLKYEVIAETILKYTLKERRTRPAVINCWVQVHTHK